MPTLFVLDERNASAFERFGENDQRLIAEADRGEDFDDFVHVVAIDFLGAPAEGFESLFVSGNVMTESSFLALTKPVGIDNGDQVVELVYAGE
jgi:hypothetical protein